MNSRPSLSPANILNLKTLDILGRGSIFDLAWSADSKRLACATTRGVWFYEQVKTDDGQVSAYKDAGFLNTDYTGVFCVSFSPDGKWLALALQGGEIQILEASSSKLSKQLQSVGFHFNRLAFSPDGKWLIVGGGKSNNSWHGKVVVCIYETENFLPIATLAVPEWLSNLPFSFDLKRLYYSTANGHVYVWNLFEQKEEAVLDVWIGDTLVEISMALSPNGLVTISTDDQTSTLKLWDTTTFEQLMEQQQLEQRAEGYLGSW